VHYYSLQFTWSSLSYITQQNIIKHIQGTVRCKNTEFISVGTVSRAKVSSKQSRFHVCFDGDVILSFLMGRKLVNTSSRILLYAIQCTYGQLRDASAKCCFAHCRNVENAKSMKYEREYTRFIHKVRNTHNIIN